MLLAGCGTPGAPQPPSLNLPDTVTDLSASRTGDQVSLTWTMPQRNTDKLLLKGIVDVRICRHEGTQANAIDCITAGKQALAPGIDGTFVDPLPAVLASGAPRPLSYFVELTNRKGRSAGLSNAATVVAGQAPAPVSGLAAEVRKEGIVLRWNSDNRTAAIRLERKLLTPGKPKSAEGPLAPLPEPAEQNLLVEPSTNSAPIHALDTHIAWGNTYEYRAQRVLRVSVAGNTVDLDGELSAPIRVEALDVFPPAVPTGLVSVATAADADAGTQAAVDLSWHSNTEADLAGYIVYRREDEADWQRISGDAPVIGPAFHDAHVVAGHTYHYAVSAVDKAGHESGRSAETAEMVPNP